jgi:hypothetical protein
MSTKNARTLGLRLDAIDDARLTRFEQATHIEGVSLARAALKAALDQFERKGSLTLPLQIIDAPAAAPPPAASSTKPFAVTRIIDASSLPLTEAEKNASRLNEDSPAVQRVKGSIAAARKKL